MRGEERGRVLALTDTPGPPAKLRRGGTTSPTVTLSIMATATLSMPKGTEAQRVWEIQGRSHKQRERADVTVHEIWSVPRRRPCDTRAS